MDIAFTPTFAAWRSLARELVEAGQEPDSFNWIPAPAAGDGLFPSIKPPAVEPRRFLVPKEFVELAELAAHHRDEGRWALLYRLLWRLAREDRRLLDDAVDDDVRRVRLMAAQVGRDIHKMHAFVRFKKLAAEERFVAWHVPDHHIVELATPFFARRFASMAWTILTPEASASWDGRELAFGPGCAEGLVPRLSDDLEELWKGYYASIFNPARIKTKMMKREMPVRHWKTLPEASLIDELLADAPRRVEEMIAQQPRSARSFVPEGAGLDALREAAKACRGCGLCERATQVVFGEGPADARIVLVGEQPGDQEDLAGRPFVGPAGQLLDRALAEAGLDRGALYLTNAVKHFKWEPQGKIRLHRRPSATEVAACRPWLDAEMKRLQPRVLVCLGVTAAQAVLGRVVRLGAERGRVHATGFAKQTYVTIHPSAILRTSGERERADAFLQLVDDLRQAADAAGLTGSRGTCRS